MSKISEKIWKLSSVHPSAIFAKMEGTAAWRGVYEERDVITNDRACGISAHFVPSSAELGDFCWIWLSLVCAKTCVLEALINHFCGFMTLPVTVDPPEKRWVRKRARRDLVPYPYTGPELALLWITHWVNADEAISTIEHTPDRPGEPSRIFHGVEEWKLIGKGPPGRHIVDWRHFPRQTGKGLFVRRSEVASRDFFRIRQLPGGMFCTDKARNFMAEKYTNIEFWEWGNVID